MNEIKFINKRLFNIIYMTIKEWNKTNKKKKQNKCCSLKKFINHIFTNMDITYNTLCLSLYHLFEIKRKIRFFLYTNNNIKNFLL